ncbi:MAG: GYD domain-containing protein [Candidatus Promineifilaceae bacterium]
MSYYMFQAAFTPEAWAGLIKNPSDVRERNRALVEALGGKLVGAWFAFGEYDVILIVEFPDNVSVAAAAVTAIAAGSGAKFKTTPLLSVEESIAVMKKAGGLPYTKPGG